MDQDAAVARFGGAVAVGGSAPLPLDDQVVIAIHPAGRDAAPLLARDAQRRRPCTVKTPFGSAYLLSRRKVYQSSRLRPLNRVMVSVGAMAWLARGVGFVEQGFGGGNEPLARPARGARGDHLVVALVEGGVVGEVGDGPVGQFGDDGQGKRRGVLDGRAQLGEDFAGQSDPGDLVAEGDHLHFGVERLAGAGGGVERFEREDGIEELDGLAGVELFGEGLARARDRRVRDARGRATRVRLATCSFAAATGCRRA